MLRMILRTTSMMPLTVGTKLSGFLGLVGPSQKNGTHWTGFWTEILKGMTRRNEWLVASHYPCTEFMRSG